MPRSYNYDGLPGFVADHGSTDVMPGRIIDWAQVPASFIPTGETKKVIESGTFMCFLASGKMVPRSAAPGAETAACLLIGGAVEDAKEAAITGHGGYIGGSFYANLLPDRADANFATWQGELVAASTGVVWQTFADSTPSP